MRLVNSATSNVDAVDAALVEPVRRHFHRDARCAPARAELREQLVQHGRVRRGVRRRRERADEAVAERADHRRAAAARVERLRDPVRARRLAVGAGDAGHPQLARRAAVDEVGDAAEPRLQVARRRGCGACHVGSHCERRASPTAPRAAPRAIASGMNVRPSARVPGIRGERVAGLDAAAVGRDAGAAARRASRAARARRGRASAAVAPRYVSSCISAAFRRQDHVVDAARRAARRACAAPRRRRSRTPARRRRRRSTARRPARRSSRRR